MHDLVRDSIRQALLTVRPVAAFPFPKRPPAAAVDEDAAVREQLADEPPLLRGPAALVDTCLKAKATPARTFRLTAPRPEPQTGRLPLETALSAYAPPLADPTASPATSDRAVPASLPGEMPRDLRPLGQVEESFIVAVNSEGLWIVDQHAAHERLLFDRHQRLRQQKKIEGQRLLMPIIVELQPEQLVTFQQIAEELRASGFEVEPFGQRTIAAKMAPAGIQGEDVEQLMLEILDGVRQEAKALSLETLRGKIAASVSCHAAIKVNTALDQAKMSWLLQELARTDCPMTCPHGRPTVLRYGLKDLLRAFKRI
jgi:DNA mismatch repair protein MutL